MLKFSKLDWPVVLGAFEISSQFLKNQHGPCPICFDATKRKKGGLNRFRFDNKDNMGTWICSNCGAGNGLTLIRKFSGLSDAEILLKIEQVANDPMLKTNDAPIIAAQTADVELTAEEVANNRRWLNMAWDRSVYLNGSDPVSQYLRFRVPKLNLNTLSPHIRFHPGLKFFEKDETGESVCRGIFPTMLARVVDGKGLPVTLHRTYLTKEGRKIAFRQAKKQMAGIRKLKGAAIRLNDVPSSRVLGMTEGVETGLAVLTGYRNRISVWSFLNCGNLAVADIPRDRFDKVIIFADHDELSSTGVRAGEHFAKLAKLKLEAEGFEVEIRLPKAVETDFADVWQSICTNVMRKVNRQVAVACV